MISPTLAWRQNFNEYREAFPSRDRNLLIVIDARTPARADAFAAQMLAELRRAAGSLSLDLVAGRGRVLRAQRARFTYHARSSSELGGPAHRRAAAARASCRLASTAPRCSTSRHGRCAAGARSPAHIAQRDAALLRSSRECSTRHGARATRRAARMGQLDLDRRRAAASTRRLIVLQPALDFGKIQPATTAINGVRAIVARLNAGGGRAGYRAA